MAAPLGFKTFNSGDVLTAADTNGYLMQGVWTFANAAARTAAVTSPQEGNVSFLKDTNSLEIYDGAAWVAYGSGDITGVTAGTGISGGGTAGDVTITNTMATAIDAKGDLIAGTGADTFSRLAVGANNTVLTADSSTATGLKWATSTSGAFTLLSTTTLSGSSTSINVSSAYTDLKIYVAGAYGSGGQMLVQWNSVTASNYGQANLDVSAGGSNTTAQDGQSGIFLPAGASGSTSDTTAVHHFYIPNYNANTSFMKTMRFEYAMVLTTGSPARRAGSGMGYYNSASGMGAITSLQFKSGSAGSWSGGTVYIYGVN